MWAALRQSASVLAYVWRHPANRGRRAGRVVRAVAWQAYKRTLARPIVIGLPNGRRFVAHPDCVISSALIYSPWPEDELRHLRAAAQPGDVLLDVGANVGHVSLLLSDRIADAVLFEPNPAAAARAEENLALNRLAYRVVRAALSDRSGVVRFSDEAGTSTTNRVDAAGTREVPALTLDEAAADLPRVDLIKIDVEGHEPAVFRGAARTFARCRPRLVLFESLSPEALRRSTDELARLGYRVYAFHDGRESTDPAVLARTQNLFAAPR